jgi:hypothetical protein
MPIVLGQRGFPEQESLPCIIESGVLCSGRFEPWVSQLPLNRILPVPLAAWEIAAADWSRG